MEETDNNDVNSNENRDTSLSNDETTASNLSQATEELVGEDYKEVCFEVTFEAGDREDKRNLSFAHKWIISALISFTSFCVTFISAAWSMASQNIQEHFHISHTVNVLGISLYVWGLGIGGIFLSPISETHGRKIVFILSLFMSLAFQILTEFSPDIGGMLFGRFMSGFFGSAFMGVAAGTISDIFSKQDIALPLLLYTISPFCGPSLSPVVCGFINLYLYFRWTFHIMTIWTGVLLIAIIIFVPETYAPVCLRKKAQRVRRETGDDRYYAPLEKNHPSLLRSIVLSSEKPILLIFRDYMTLMLCLFCGYTLAIVYLFFVSFPYIYRTVWGFNLHQQGLAFLGIIIGMSLTAILTTNYFKKKEEELIKKNGNKPKSEFKFLPLFFGVFVFPTGLMVVGWTSYSHLHWIGPIIGSGILGSGIVLVFNGVFAYTVDAYRLYAASAMATNTCVRCVMSGVFPLFALQMYERLGIQWASTLLACLGYILVPIPFVFYKYGELLRKKSAYTWSEDDA